jgi:hypothetical protein
LTRHEAAAAVHQLRLLLTAAPGQHRPSLRLQRRRLRRRQLLLRRRGGWGLAAAP